MYVKHGSVEVCNAQNRRFRMYQRLYCQVLVALVSCVAERPTDKEFLCQFCWHDAGILCGQLDHAMFFLLIRRSPDLQKTQAFTLSRCPIWLRAFCFSLLVYAQCLLIGATSTIFQQATCRKK